MKHAKIKNYQNAKGFLNGRKSKNYANNTRLVVDSLDLGHDVITVLYHENPVVNFFPDGVVTFSSCGWKTSTTKERINWFLPDGFSLYQDKSVWHVSKRGTSYNYIFSDGLAIDSHGNVYNDAPADNTKQTIKSIKKYVDGYIKNLLNEEVENPSGSDCWYCFMQADGKSLGEVTNNTEHILSHFEESYFVPSLLMNAYKFNNRLSMLARDGIARLMNGESISEWQSDITSRDVKSCLTSYLKHILGVAQ